MRRDRICWISLYACHRKVDVREGNSNSHDARPVHLIITMIKWIRTSRLSIKNSLSVRLPGTQTRSCHQNLQHGWIILVILKHLCSKFRYSIVPDPTVGLCLEPYGGARGGVVSYERGTPVHTLYTRLYTATCRGFKRDGTLSKSSSAVWYSLSLSLSLSVCLSLSLSVSLSACLSVCLSVCLSLCLSACHSLSLSLSLSLSTTSSMGSSSTNTRRSGATTCHHIYQKHRPYMKKTYMKRPYISERKTYIRKTVCEKDRIQKYRI